MTERSRRITTFIFLLSIFVFLAVIVFVWSYRYYQVGRIQATNMSKSAVECGGYVYRVVDDTMSYENKRLKFRIEYIGEGSNKFKRLSVLVKNTFGASVNENLERSDYNLIFSEDITTLLRSPTVTIKDIEIEDEFLISPEGCELYNVKKCSLSTKKCVVR